MINLTGHMSDQIDPYSLILVSIVKEPRDLEIARLLGWYRIPLRSSPKVVAVDYLAFYQTGSFSDEKWQIKYLAPVRGYELTTRIELLKDEPDHPHANHEYYKVQLGSLIQLENPIHAGKWRRITFLYTTGEYLKRAGSINDLVVQSEERPLLWRALRERTHRDSVYEGNDLPDLEIDAETLARWLGIQ